MALEKTKLRFALTIAIDEQDNIYGADVSYNPATEGWISDVWRVTPEGKLIYLLEPTEHAPRGMSIWRDRAGNMYFIDQNNHTKRETVLLPRSPAGKGTTAESAIVFFSPDGRLKYSIAFVSVSIVSLIALVQQRRRRAGP